MKLHRDIDPARLQCGPRVSRGSNATPIAVFFDHTGSCTDTAQGARENLKNLRRSLRDIVPHPQILVGAFGDADVDQYPFQVGKFRSDNSYIKDLDHLYLEGGGGLDPESHGLTCVFAAHFTKLETKKKAYLFIVGDDAPSKGVLPEDVRNIFALRKSLFLDCMNMSQLVSEAAKRWEIYRIVVAARGYVAPLPMPGLKIIQAPNSSLISQIIAHEIKETELESTSR